MSCVNSAWVLVFMMLLTLFLILVRLCYLFDDTVHNPSIFLLVLELGQLHGASYHVKVMSC